MGSGRNSWKDLIDAAKKGDDAAMNLIVSKLSVYLTSIARTHRCQLVQAKFGNSDVVQQTLLEGCKNLEQFSGSSEFQLEAWFKQILIRNFIDFIRRYRETEFRDVSREANVDDHNLSQAIDLTPSRQIMLREDELELIRAIEALPDRDRFVIEARHHWHWPYSKIANELQISEQAVRKMNSRALQRLKGLLVD